MMIIVTIVDDVRTDGGGWMKMLRGTMMINIDDDIGGGGSRSRLSGGTGCTGDAAVVEVDNRDHSSSSATAGAGTAQTSLSRSRIDLVAMIPRPNFP